MKKLTWSFYFLFSLLFLMVIINVTFNNPYTDTAYILPFSAVFFILLTYIFKYFNKHKDILDKKHNLILYIFSAVMLIIKIAIGKSLEFDPAFDMGAIYHGAVEWVETGKFTSYYDYFQWFPNNLGAMIFLFLFFKLFSIFGITNYFMIGVVINSLLSVCMMIITALVCKKLTDTAHSLFVLVLFALSLPFYVIGAVFYTDALSMIFPVLFIYLYILSSEAENKKRKIILYILMSCSIALGMQIKFTVTISAIALIIDIIVNKNHKKALTAAGSIAVASVIVSLIFNSLAYTNNLDKNIAKEKNTPYSHWIMMGLNNEGAYSADDYNFTRSFSNTKERNKAINDEIISRIKEKGYKGLFELYTVKATKDFGDGTYALSDFLDDSPVNDSSLHKYVLYDGEKYKSYANFCTGMHIAVICLMLLYSSSFIFKKKNNITSNLYLCMSVFGIFIFLMLWETNARYFTNYIPIIFICATLGINSAVEFTEFIHNKFRDTFKYH